MQITKSKLKNIIKEEIERFLIKEAEELSPEGTDALQKLMQIQDPEEVKRIFSMIQANQSI
jgi:succinate dehydrogenase flavin-adding protein (antitoxin of CptAB toxin-antitoxin module)